MTRSYHFREKSDWPEVIGLCTILVVVLLLVGLIGKPAPIPPSPRLIGLGCNGAGGTLYANEEDHFPRPCKEIYLNE